MFVLSLLIPFYLRNMNSILSTQGNIIWVRNKKIQDFLEAIWIDAFVENDSCVKDGCDYDYEFNWNSNLLTITPYNEKGENYVTITHNLKLYRYAFDLMKKEVMTVFGSNILPKYLKDNMPEDNYQFLTNMTKLRLTKNLSFTYYDSLDEMEESNNFNFPEFCYWYKYPEIYNEIYRGPLTDYITNFMEKIYFRICQNMEENPNCANLDTKYWDHIKECFFTIFPSEKHLDEVMTNNKELLNFYNELV